MFKTNFNLKGSTDSNETHEFKFNYFLVDNKFDKIKEEVFSSSDSQHTDDCARTVTKKRRTRFTSSQVSHIIKRQLMKVYQFLN